MRRYQGREATRNRAGGCPIEASFTSPKQAGRSSVCPRPSGGPKSPSTASSAPPTTVTDPEAIPPRHVSLPRPPPANDRAGIARTGPDASHAACQWALHESVQPVHSNSRSPALPDRCGVDGGLPSLSTRPQSERRNVLFAHLLDLGNEQPRPNGMDRSRRHKNTVARLRLNSMQEAFDLASVQRLSHLVTIHRLGKSRPKTAPRLRLDHIPGLRFSRISQPHFRRATIVGVNLQGKVLVGVKVLQEQGKTAARSVPAQQSLTPQFHNLAKRNTCQRTGRNDALPVRMVGDFPTLREDPGRRQISLQDGLKTSPAPEIILVNRIKAKRIEIGHKTGLF